MAGGFVNTVRQSSSNFLCREIIFNRQLGRFLVNFAFVERWLLLLGRKMSKRRTKNIAVKL